METFTVRHALPTEYAEIADLVARVFSQGDPDSYQQSMHFWIFSRPRAPYFDYRGHRIAVLNGRVVAHTVVLPFTLRYGGVTLRVAGVGAVCTHPDYRGKGYASAVLRDALAYMAEQGAHLSLLHSAVENYYEKFGFSPVFPRYTFEIDSAQAAALDASRHTLRPARLEDVPALAALYERHWAWRVTFTRSADLWLWRVRDTGWSVRVVEDAAGQVVGYTAAREAFSERTEAVADTPTAALALLADAGKRYQQAKIDAIRWLLPPDDAIITAARGVLPVRLGALYRPSGGWMGRLIDPGALVQTLLPEISAQAASMRADFDSRTLTLNCLPDAVQINDSITLAHQDFLQVMFGSLRPAALMQRGDAVTYEGARLLEALFPPRMAALAAWDWF